MKDKKKFLYCPVCLTSGAIEEHQNRFECCLCGSTLTIEPPTERKEDTVKDKIQKVVDTYKKLHHELDIARECFGFTFESSLGDSITKMIDMMISNTSELIGDTNEFLEWHIYENGCGEKGHLITIDGVEFEICNAEDLEEVILLWKEVRE